MSIRRQILLVSAVAVLAVAIGFYREISLQLKSIDALKSGQALIVDAQNVSSAVHSLQLERGLSIGYSAEQNPSMFDELKSQRLVTDQALKAIGGHLWSAQHLKRFTDALAEARRQIDGRKLDQDALLAFFSRNITNLFDEVAMASKRDMGAGVSSGLSPLFDLAGARESLGLIRALVNRAYLMDNIEDGDLIAIAHHHGMFLEKLRLFHRDADQELKTLFSKAVTPELFGDMNREITEILTTRKVSRQEPAHNWWQGTTQVIDALKSLESQGFTILSKNLSRQIEEMLDAISAYGLFALLLTVLVAVLAVRSVVRIVRALTALLGSVDDVMGNKNFDARIHSSHQDEFSKIGDGLNALFEFTGQLVAEKEMQASTDPLTGLANRRSFLDQAEKEMDRAKRYHKDMALIICDLDHFKQINDTLGHQAGDDVLVGFSRLLEQCLRASDFAARWGGEEFVILAPESDVQQAVKLAEKLRSAAEAHNFTQSGGMTCSFGVAQWTDGETIDALIARADMALYEAKQDGRNKVKYQSLVLI